MTLNPQLSLWEKADLIAGRLSVLSTALYTAITGLFRGQNGAKEYSLHVGNAVIRKMILRLSTRQLQYMNGSTSDVYSTFMKQKNLHPETVPLEHGAQGHWIGNPEAKYVVVYYHGGGFALPGFPNHLAFYNRLGKTLNEAGHDIAFFILSYSLTPQAAYPTQLQQAVAALRHILSTPRSPSKILLGGDSAGGNLALAVLLHLSHPHPEIDPLPDIAPLAGLFAFAPWVDFGNDTPSMQENAGKDVIVRESLESWSSAYLGGKEADAWSEPSRAPTEWWREAKVERVLLLVGRDEVLFGGIDAFVERFQSVVPNTTYVVGFHETHVAPVYGADFLGNKETQQGKGLKEWLASHL
ncbi:Alpha/Beta hydrolase protein [Aspergillus avenaceus]|uniref:Alpha/Beta hydrolase protein n=1 Tax=Aspergillus avenaceus TaxID=36643 RepID=A0A5N6TDB9_ASPAV|nr:Alpha/Beta hydrolase protein [Aspergillus avenaceus]